MILNYKKYNKLNEYVEFTKTGEKLIFYDLFYDHKFFKKGEWYRIICKGLKDKKYSKDRWSFPIKGMYIYVIKFEECFFDLGHSGIIFDKIYHKGEIKNIKDHLDDYDWGYWNNRIESSFLSDFKEVEIEHIINIEEYKRKEKLKELNKNIDPYGEEEWDDSNESIFNFLRMRREEYDDITDYDDSNLIKVDIDNYIKEIEHLPGLEFYRELCFFLNTHLQNNTSVEFNGMKLFNKYGETEIPKENDSKKKYYIDGYVKAYPFVFHKIDKNGINLIVSFRYKGRLFTKSYFLDIDDIKNMKINKNIKSPKRIISGMDPYGEEDWSDIVENSKTYKTFDDLEFEVDVNLIQMIPKGLKCHTPLKSRMIFDNGYSISVIHGGLSYSDEDTYEIAIFDKNGRFVLEGDVMGYQTKEDVSKEMIKVQKIKPPKRIFTKEDPYGEEDWINESKEDKPKYKFGEKVYFFGNFKMLDFLFGEVYISDRLKHKSNGHWWYGINKEKVSLRDKVLSRDEGTTRWICEDELYDNEEDYFKHKEEYDIRMSNYKEEERKKELKKQELRIKMMDIDPYGEEEWVEDEEDKDKYKWRAIFPSHGLDVSGSMNESIKIVDNNTKKI